MPIPPIPPPPRPHHRPHHYPERRRASRSPPRCPIHNIPYIYWRGQFGCPRCIEERERARTPLLEPPRCPKHFSYKKRVKSGHNLYGTLYKWICPSCEEERARAREEIEREAAARRRGRLADRLKAAGFLSCVGCHRRLSASCETCLEEKMEIRALANQTGDLHPCPNPSCRYSCQPDWEECPICHTSLKINIP